MSLYQRLSKLRQASREQPQELLPKVAVGDDLPGQQVKNAFGTYWVVEDVHLPFSRVPCKNPVYLCEDLQLLFGIGPATEARLHAAGYRTLQDLTAHPRWAEQAQTAIDCLQKEDVAAMRRMGAGDEFILPYFGSDDIVYLDIETTGLWCTQPLFLVGLLFYDGDRLRSRQLLARNLREEKPLLAGLIQELEKFSLIITYNGRSFDIPYIENRTVAHRLFYRSFHEQIDLLRHARRHFRGVLPDCRLVTLEEHLLNKKRMDDVPGYLIPSVYHQYVRTRDGRLLAGIMEHNKDDLLAMEGMLPLVSEKTNAQLTLFFNDERSDAGSARM